MSTSSAAHLRQVCGRPQSVGFERLAGKMGLARGAFFFCFVLLIRSSMPTSPRESLISFGQSKEMSACEFHTTIQNKTHTDENENHRRNPEKKINHQF